MDKSPLKTLTLEEFLEGARARLTGALTPVTPETFARWKQERLDKKAAEEEARRAKEATGRALFEKGDWQLDEDDEADDDDDDDHADGGDGDNDAGAGGAWNFAALRRETEEARERREMERIHGVKNGGEGSGGGGGGVVNGDDALPDG
jgi:hypothetical protein